MNTAIQWIEQTQLAKAAFRHFTSFRCSCFLRYSVVPGWCSSVICRF